VQFDFEKKAEKGAKLQVKLTKPSVKFKDLKSTLAVMPPGESAFIDAWCLLDGLQRKLAFYTPADAGKVMNEVTRRPTDKVAPLGSFSVYHKLTIKALPKEQAPCRREHCLCVRWEREGAEKLYHLCAGSAEELATWEKALKTMRRRCDQDRQVGSGCGGTVTIHD
jgi:hypothetical protein